MQNAKAANMPKDTVERAIKKATDKDASDFKEITYEGYGPYGIAIFVEAATDNNTRTVANVRSYFTKSGGSLGTQGSLTFLFDHKSVFKIKPKEGVGLEDLELELIDYGVDELVDDEDEEGNELVVLYGGLKTTQTYRSTSKKTALKSSHPNSNASPTTSRKLHPSSAKASTSSSNASKTTKTYRTFSIT